MSLRAIATLVIAIVLGLAAVLIVNSFINNANKGNAPSATTATGPASPVVVAAKPIGRGIPITADLLKVVNFPAGAAPEGSFSAVNQLAGTTKDTQRLALRDLGPGEPVLATRVSAPGQKINLSDILAPGMQAVTLRTNDVAGVGGFILPGDHVDIFLTRSVPPPSGGANTTLVQVVVENVKVLGIDQLDDDEAAKPAVVKAITVEVTPQQAQTITLAQTVGSISFALRHVQDTAKLTRVATTTAALGFGPPAPRSRRPDQRFGVVRVTRATETTVYQLSAR